MSDKLPQGWTRATLDEIRAEDAPIIYGILQPGPDVDGGVPYVRPTEIVRDEIQVSQLRRTSDAIANKYQRAILRPGDVVFTIVGSIGKAALVPPELAGANITQSSSRIRPKPSVVEPLYLKFALKSPGIVKQCEDFKLGTAVPRLNLEDVRKLEVSLAPLAEQQRIVAKLEKLLSQSDTSKQRLARIDVLLKRFRQSVLAAACSGRLTADWRDENPGDETRLGVLVELIRRRRETDAKTPAQREKLREIYDQEEKNDSGTLPLGWGFVALAKLCGSFDYGTSTKSQPTGKVPVLRMGNIQNGKLYWDDLVYTSDHAEIEDYRLQPKTVLFNRTNSPELVGKTAIYLGERPAIFAGYLIRVNQCPELDPEYLNFCLNTSYAHEFCQSVKTDGVSQSNINAQKLGHFEAPFCPLPEQQEIVRRVKKLFALADRIEARFAEGRRRVNSITQALLAKAFRGELVPTEFELAKSEGRSFESAEELLERIGRNGEPKSKLRAKSSNPSLLAQDHSLNQAKDPQGSLKSGQ